jgi:flagellar motor protein MotB
MEEKKKNKLSKIKKNVRLKSLNPGYATRVRKELLDADYLKDLNDEELKWYAQFTDEWTAGAISKGKTGIVKPGHIHRTNKQAKELYDANNKRNNDVFGVTKANFLMTELNTKVGVEDSEIESRQITNVNLTEQAVVTQLDDSKDELKIFENSELLTKREFLKLLKHGAKVPKEMFEFYKKYYKLELNYPNLT